MQVLGRISGLIMSWYDLLPVLPLVVLGAIMILALHKRDGRN
jgi:hypothetical protein